MLYVAMMMSQAAQARRVCVEIRDFAVLLVTAELPDHLEVQVTRGRQVRQVRWAPLGLTDLPGSRAILERKALAATLDLQVGI